MKKIQRPPITQHEADRTAVADAAEDSHSAFRLARLLPGVLLLAAVIAIATHFGEAAGLPDVMGRLQSLPLLTVAVLQCGTYLCVALILRQSLACDNQRLPLRRLFLLALSKQFVSQTVPSAGLSGNAVLLRGLHSVGVTGILAVRSVLLSLFSHCLAFSIALASTIAFLWSFRTLTSTTLTVLTILLSVMTVFSMTIFWFGNRAQPKLPQCVRRWFINPETEGILSGAGNAQWDFGLMLSAVLLQLTVFLLDSGTLWVALDAIGSYVDPRIAFSALVSATAVASIGLVPGGLGTFEGTCVAMLHTHGVDIETALAATLILRGFTFWLPLIPGSLATRHVR